MNTFTPTHRVPHALPTWPVPDGNLAEGATLASGTKVEVLEERADGWAHVRCDNGWTAWVDGRRLRRVAVAGEPSDKPSPLVLAGTALVFVGTFLPWVRGSGASLNAWQMPVKFLLGRENDLGGPNVGLVLLVAVALAVAPAAMRRPIPWVALASGAAIVTEAVGMTLLRVRALDLNPSVSIGAVFALVGAALFALEAGLTATRK